VNNDDQLLQAANWYLYRYGNPIIRVGTVTFRPYTTPGLATLACTLEPGDKITINNLPANAPATSLDFIIESIGHANISNDDWTVKLSLSPWIAPVVIDDTSHYGNIDDYLINTTSYGVLIYSGAAHGFVHGHRKNVGAEPLKSSDLNANVRDFINSFGATTSYTTTWAATNNEPEHWQRVNRCSILPNPKNGLLQDQHQFWFNDNVRFRRVHGDPSSPTCSELGTRQLPRVARRHEHVPHSWSYQRVHDNDAVVLREQHHWYSAGHQRVRDRSHYVDRNLLVTASTFPAGTRQRDP
jgi:hypothetical protein